MSYLFPLSEWLPSKAKMQPSKLLYCMPQQYRMKFDLTMEYVCGSHYHGQSDIGGS